VTVRAEREGEAVWIRWSRPERLNAWDGETLAALGAALAEAAGSDPRAVVLYGEGGAFSAGDDLRETVELAPEEWARTLTAFNRLTREVVAAPQPVIAAVDGVCVGGAFELAVACDVRVVSPRSRLGCPEVAIGLSISNGFSLLAPRAARRLVLTGELVGAEEALRLGLVDAVVEDVEAEARRLVERIAALAPLAVAGSKRLLDEGQREALERALDREAALCEQLFETGDAREGLAAFLEKREPRFRGV
jgi:enoyl-CoA hydratase